MTEDTEGPPAFSNYLAKPCGAFLNPLHSVTVRELNLSLIKLGVKKISGARIFKLKPTASSLTLLYRQTSDLNPRRNCDNSCPFAVHAQQVQGLELRTLRVADAQAMGNLIFKQEE